MPQAHTHALLTLGTLARTLQPIIQRLSTSHIILSKNTLLELNVEQLRTLNFPPAQFEDSLLAVNAFLDQDWLHPFQTQSTSSGIAFKLHPFYCDHVEKTILLGTALDWLNITEPLNDSQQILQTQSDNASLSSQQVNSALLQNINSLRTLYILVHGYLLPRLLKMATATPQPLQSTSTIASLETFANTYTPLIQKLASILDSNIPTPLKPTSLTIAHDDSHLLTSLSPTTLNAFAS